MKRLALTVWACCAAAVLIGCAAVPDKQSRATQYDFGPGAVDPAAAPPAKLPALVLAEIESSTALDGSALLYRLGYADAHQLHPYALARWSAPPPQLIRQRLRELLARERPVLDFGESSALARVGGTLPRILRLELEEFSQWFESPAQSAGLVRLRATLMENTPAGERLLDQRSVAVRRPAPTSDAPGGVRALTAATDAAAEEIAQWLRQQP
jgi:cholesterol transport system auxiliary component